MAQFSKLEAADFKAMTAEQIAAFSSEQMAAISPAQWNALSTDAIASLSTDTIASLSLLVMKKMSSKQFDALSVEQLNALNGDQIEALGSKADKLLVGPLVLDLNHDGVLSVSVDDGVQFDHVGSGKSVKTGWISAGDALLVMDRNGNGLIDTGAELFGHATLLPNGRTASDGYAALSNLDTHRDGRVDARDVNFSQLMLWVDRNANGKTDAGELISLAEAGIVSLNLNSQSSSAMQAGNRIALTSAYTQADGTQGIMADVWFRVKSADTAALIGTTSVTEIALLLA